MVNYGTRQEANLGAAASNIETQGRSVTAPQGFNPQLSTAPASPTLGGPMDRLRRTSCCLSQRGW